MNYFFRALSKFVVNMKQEYNTCKYNRMSLFNFFKKSDEEQQQPKAVSNFYMQEQLKLPQNFAQTVMDLQMQMQFVQSCDLDVVQQLNELYRTAVQYYANIDTKKSEHFQRKLTSLLTNPNTIDVIQKKKISVKTAHLDPGLYSQNLKQQLNKFNSQSQIVVKSMIEGNDKKMQQHSKLITQNLESQETKLQRRLEQRSRSKTKKNT